MIVHTACNIAPALWYKLGGTVKQFIQVSTKDELINAVESLHETKTDKYFICGTGSNLIFAAEYFDGTVIQITRTDTKDIVVKGNEITAYAGEILGDVISESFEHTLTGLEWAGGLPGTVGAAVRGNVGAYGGEIKDHFISAEVLEHTETGVEIKDLQKEDMHFVYRGSVIKDNRKLIVLSATFSLETANAEKLAFAKEIYEKNKESRIKNHPLEYPNCGSVFKNLRDKDQIEKVLSVFPDLKENVEKKWYGKVAVASPIERLGLKGYRVGNAQISEKHALFIVNLGDAIPEDVLAIIKKVQETFMEKFGFTLETEVEIVS
jgi:UDP-N-acetylmuramate dehydrogenase